MKNSRFRDVILVVVFNYANCLNNKEAIRALYAPWFRKIIFYSDLPQVEGHDDVHFLEIGKGFTTHAIFPDLWARYRADLENSAGVMYTMDDCILNVHRLDELPVTRVVCNYGSIVPRTEYRDLEGWHWSKPHGVQALDRLFASEPLPEIEMICGSFSDFFYLPRQFLVPRMFELFDIFARAGVFLEIAIPTIIHHIAQGRTHTGHWEQTILWQEERKKIHDRQYLMDALDRCHFFHPVKFNESPNFLPWVKDFIHSRRPGEKNRKCIIITTINAPNDFVEGYARKPGWDLIVVGDSKTRDADYADLNCVYLGLDKQKELYPSLYEKIPLKSYTRKMFGYLYAIQHGYEVIYETDDDNWYRGDLDNFDCGLHLSKFVDFPGDDLTNIELPNFTPEKAAAVLAEHGSSAFTYETNSNKLWVKKGIPKTQSAHPTTISGQIVVPAVAAEKGFVNLYRNFSDERIWPRGIPPSHTRVDHVPGLEVGAQPQLPVAVIQGLVDNDPDVDAHYRIYVSDQPFFFRKNVNLEIALEPSAVCPFNTQNTFWTDPSVFHALYLPTTVTFRYTDILRGFVALYQLWRSGKTIKFTGPSAFQTRNPHDLQKDYESEVPMYETAEQVIALLEANPHASLVDVYRILAKAGVVQPAEIEVAEEWMRLVETFQAARPAADTRPPLSAAVASHRNSVLDPKAILATATKQALEMAVLSSGTGFALSDADIDDLMVTRDSISAVWTDVVDKLIDAAHARRRNLFRFDHINMMSLGADCFSRVVLSRWGFKRTSKLGERSAPFDLAVTYPEAVLALLENDFDGFMEPANLRFSEENLTCTQTRYGVHFNHEVGRQFAANDFARLREMYAGRIAGFREMLADPTPLFLLITLPVFIPAGRGHLDLVQKIRRRVMDLRTGPTSMLVVNSAAPGQLSPIADVREPGFEWVNVEAPAADYVWHDAQCFMSDAGVAYEKAVAALIERHLKQAGIADIPDAPAGTPVMPLRPEVLIAGHSHTACLQAGPARSSDGSTLVNLLHPSQRVFGLVAAFPRARDYWDKVVQHARGKITAILWQGDRPLAQHFFKPGIDVTLSEYPDLPCDPTAQLVPEAALKVTLAAGLERLAGLIEAVKQNGGFPLVCGTPPPKEDEAAIRRALLPEFKGLLDEMEVDADTVPLASPQLRFKVWALTQHLLRELAHKHGVGFFPVPTALQTERGFLRPEFCASDVIHANERYGEVFLASLMTLVDQNQDKWRAAA